MSKLIMFLLILLALAIVFTPETKYEPKVTAEDEATMNEIKKEDWVKEILVSPGHLNIGILPLSGNRNLAEVAIDVCTVLKKHGSTLNFVRFTDINETISHHKILGDAEVAKYHC